MAKLPEDILYEEYLGDTRDDKRIINFLRSSDCTKKMVNYRNDDGWCALNLTAKSNRWEVVEELLKKEADPNYVSWDTSYNSLMYCIAEGSSYDPKKKENRLKTIKLLIEAGTNLNYEDRFSAFTIAASIDDTDVIKLLIEQPINIAFKDEDDKTGIDYLLEYNNDECLSLIKEKILSCDTWKDYVLKNKNTSAVKLIEKYILKETLKETLVEKKDSKNNKI